ncbi:hypothetical protein [Mariprofundus sp. NF]|nr:hypothetical protein [Mariprofundus sp. NF]
MSSMHADGDELKAFNRFFFKMIAGAALLHAAIAAIVAYNV